MKTPIIIALSLAVASLLTGCIGPGYPVLRPDDAAKYAILEQDAQGLSKLADHEIIDFSSIDGISSDKIKNRRIERDLDGKLTKIFLLIEPKHYTLTLRYTKALYHVVGWEFLYGDVTYDYDLSPGFYRIDARADDRFAYLSLIDSNGQKIGEAGKSVLKSVTPSSTFVPIPIIVK
jgi:hypothetical protein